MVGSHSTGTPAMLTGRAVARPRAVSVIEATGESRPPGRIAGDRDLLSRALDALLDNAVRHGAPPVRLDIRREAEDRAGIGDAIAFDVSDGGAGLPARWEALAGRSPFQAGDDASRATGTGMSLLLASAIAVAHGGALRYERRAERTVFALVLPRR